MKEKVIAMIADKLNVSEDKITMKSKFVEDLGADSLDVVELIMTLEDELNVNLPDEQVSNMFTVGDIITYLESIKK